jgi:L-alanine-DL-glutamate epimerase-like enolase superfamily enzyme
MNKACRNLGRPGVVSAAVAAVDIALWDLKARLLEQPLTALLGRARDDVPVYGSGGFTNLTDDQLAQQLDEWLGAGCQAVKIKVGEAWGSNTARDIARAAAVRERVGSDIAVMVDANGGYSPGQAARIGRAYDDLGVSWFEEPVSSDDLAALALLRHKLSCDIAAGEYADSTQYVLRMCAAGAVDCLQIDVTRCAGYTEWLRCAAIAAAHGLEVSGHCAPALHAAVAAAVPNLRHVEWFVDHARLEPLLVDGVPAVRAGAMVPGDSPGHGMTLASTAEQYRIR